MDIASRSGKIKVMVSWTKAASNLAGNNYQDIHNVEPTQKRKGTSVSLLLIQQASTCSRMQDHIFHKPGMWKILLPKWCQTRQNNFLIPMKSPALWTSYKWQAQDKFPEVINGNIWLPGTEPAPEKENFRPIVQCPEFSTATFWYCGKQVDELFWNCGFIYILLSTV